MEMTSELLDLRETRNVLDQPPEIRKRLSTYLYLVHIQAQSICTLTRLCTYAEAYTNT